MKRLSIRTKVTLWYGIILLVVMLFTSFVVLYAGNSIIQKTIRDNLVESVESNVVEIEYYTDEADIDLSDTAHYMIYDGGYLRIDDDFLDSINEIYSAIYDNDGNLIYGENPIFGSSVSVGFSDLQIQTVKAGGTTYYIFDRSLTDSGLEGLWLRGVVSSEQGTAQMNSIINVTLIVLPLLVILACIGGFLISGRMLRPIGQISKTARSIEKSGDLKKRIDIGPGKDELHELAESFNTMFEKLDSSLETERRFISDASHELRTPMSVISAQCEIALEVPQSREDYEEALTVIYRQSQKMNRLINGMLDFTRLEMNAERYTMEELDLSELVRDTCTDMALIRDKNISLTSNVEEGIYTLGNRELLTRALTNLISNAYRYGRENGRIHVSLAANAPYIYLTVSDNGVGIKTEDLDKIFGRFFQADSSRSGDGLGLGLSMAKEIASFHGGDITVESAWDVGSIFTITLPEKN